MGSLKYIPIITVVGCLLLSIFSGIQNTPKKAKAKTKKIKKVKFSNIVTIHRY